MYIYRYLITIIHREESPGLTIATATVVHINDDDIDNKPVNIDIRSLNTFNPHPNPYRNINNDLTCDNHVNNNTNRRQDDQVDSQDVGDIGNNREDINRSTDNQDGLIYVYPEVMALPADEVSRNKGLFRFIDSRHSLCIISLLFR